MSCRTWPPPLGSARRWSHLLREIRHLQEQHPQDQGLWRWAAQVRAVYRRARRLQAQPLATPARLQAQRRGEADLLQVCTPFLQADSKQVPQATLCRRIQQYLPELFPFVSDPELESTNNRAERAIRPVVCQRKISGGTRSPAGTHTFCTLQTLFGTWRAQNRDPLVGCRRLLYAYAAAQA